MVEMDLLATAVLERDRPTLLPKFQVTDYQVRAFFQQHPDLFRNRSLADAKEEAVALATADRHDQVMKAYLEAARRAVDFKEGPGLHAGPGASPAEESLILARVGGRVLVEADFEAFLAVSLDAPQRAQLPLTPGARDLYLKRFLDDAVLAAKARLEGLK